MKTKHVLIGLFLMICCFGCAGKSAKPLSADVEGPNIFRIKASEYEAAEDYPKALLFLNAARKLSPSDTTIEPELLSLKTKAVQKANAHFEKGVSYFEKNNPDAAQYEFLTALRYNPNHSEALSYVKHRLNQNMYQIYSVKKGDTLKSIAKEVYKDADKDFLVAYFNDLDSKAPLETGAALKLPIIEPPKTAPKRAEAEKAVAAAKSQFESKQYEKAATTAEKVIESSEYFDPAVEEMLNASYYQMGVELTRKKKYLEALDILNKADASYKGIQEAISDVRKYLKNEAEECYRRGVKFYVEEKLDNAIKEWEKALSLDPDHEKAKKDIEKTKTILEKLKRVN